MLDVVTKRVALELGQVAFFYRPRVEEQHADELADVQRILMELAPSGTEYRRLIAIGRKRLPGSRPGQRYWGFVDLVLSPADMHAALGAQVYGTATRGLRHLPAAHEFARGSYEVELHGEHTHLRWSLDALDADDAVAKELSIPRSGDSIVSIANPDPAAWGLVQPPDLQGQLFDEAEVHVTVPTPFPEALQEKFAGRRYMQLDSAEWLNHPGAELLFIDTSDDPTMKGKLKLRS